MLTAGVAALVVLAAVLLQGAGSSVIGNVVTPESSVFTVFAAFGAAALIGMASRLRGGTVTTRAPGRYVLLVNLYSAGAFTLFYLSTTLTVPTAASVVETSMAPMVLGALAVRGRTASRTVLPVLLNAASVAWVLWLVAQQDGFGPRTVAGVAAAVCAGLCALGVLTTSRRLGEIGCDTSYINSIRFHGCWLAGGALFALDIGSRPVEWGELAVAGLLAVPCITVPIVALQYGITRAPVATSAALVSLLPVVVFVVDAIVFRRVDAAMLGPVLCILAAAYLGLRKPSAPSRPPQSRPLENAVTAD
ncbi:hypothetical protein NDR87_14725 [Nocardia sp. CDC159]|uniref:EamA-like transporter family protein n=1 Tax=Nocardia pulmonis TaxID=2951408 RepID=A0A9X2IWH5_9NOCA|nr:MULTISPECIES: hypothetical protein [Nocardia]MCM6774323.1 hypothetical protein [Nocardia pulmonis]MCM6787611.1 hypothetical protein [Nocardia sp. CDC159]